MKCSVVVCHSSELGRKGKAVRVAERKYVHIPGRISKDHFHRGLVLHKVMKFSPKNGMF